MLIEKSQKVESLILLTWIIAEKNEIDCVFWEKKNKRGYVNPNLKKIKDYLNGKPLYSFADFTTNLAIREIKNFSNLFGDSF